MLTATEVADLRTDVRLHHQTLNDLKTEALNIVTLLDDNLHELDLLDDTDENVVTNSEYDLLKSTRDLTYALYHRLQSGEDSLKALNRQNTDTPADAEAPKQEPEENDDN